MIKTAFYASITSNFPWHIFKDFLDITEQWEKDLEAELNEYEVVADKADDKQLEKEYEDLLGDGDDLK